MTEIGGMLASAVLKVVTQQIGSVIGSQVRMQRNFSDDLEKLRMLLESVEAVLKDAERRSIKDAAVRLWLERLKNSMYDISNVIDEFEANTKPAARKFAIMVSCHTVVSKITMANKMKKMTEQLETITSQHRSFSFTTDIRSNVQRFVDVRETSSNVEEALIVGRIEEKHKIMASLCKSMAQEIILPIYGIGGIGKTTLAQWVFNCSHFKDYCKVWIYVSQKFDLNKIGNSILSQISEEQIQMTERQMINNRLGKLLAGKKILIILDDLWEKDPSQLADLQCMLKVGGGHKVVVVTTRDEEIAMKMCTVEPFKMEPLTNDLCWTIVKQKCAFEFRADKERLELIGREIAKKCGGVALAAQSIGYMLQSMTYDEWRLVKNSDIWNILAAEDASSPHHVPASLKLSYSSMPPLLKLCFAYCATFPKGHSIVKDDLIHQWSSLGFIKPVNIFSTRQLGENYVSHLLGMSFLQYSKSDLTGRLHDKDVTLFTMHDLVHDLARSIMANEVLDASKNGSIGGSSCLYAMLTDCSKPLNLSVISPAKIRTLRFLDCGKIVVCGAAFSSAKYLRVLDLSECSIQKLPHSIGRLKYLRYLNAPRMQDQMIPKCITKLSKLNYLNLRGSSKLLALPESMGNIEDLLHLDLSGCWRIEKLPKSFVELTSLVHLDLSQCYMVDGIPEALRVFTKLQYLNLSLRYWIQADRQHLRGLPEVIGNLTKLRYLNLSWCMRAIFAVPSTDKINSSPGRCSISENSSTDQTDSFMDHISTLSNLEHLDLSENIYLVSIPECVGSLRKLHTLDLSGCDELARLPDSMVEMDSLKILNVKGCHELDNSILFRFNLFALLPHFVVHAGDGESSSNFVLLQHANPDELQISRIENVKSTEEVQSIKLVEKQRIVELKLEWTAYAEKFVDDLEVLGELVPPSTLKKFEIQGYNCVDFPAWVLDISHYLPNLVSIMMVHLPKCNNLPPLGQLPNLQSLVLERMHNIMKIDEGFTGGARAFLRLERLELTGMEGLEEWTTIYSSGEDGTNKLMFPNLEILRIRDCPKLRLKPCLPRAAYWVIWNSDNVLLTQGESVTCTSASSSPVTTLDVGSCELPLHQWRLLHHLPALCKLTISDCNDLTSSSDIIRALSSLQSLHISSWRSMASLPLWLGELNSLKKFEIWGFKGIGAFLEIIQQLTNLKELQTVFCPELKQWCESKENKLKLAHIKETVGPSPTHSSYAEC
uniref:Disease resistance protein RGA3 n=1 Tax=Aegilops tauschii subsp. strangulata TaxID=200361 RepID=A0A453HKW9_AEGTS